MKHILKSIAVAAFILISSTSCSQDARKIVETAISEGNKECPVAATSDITMVSMTVEDNAVVYTYLILENELQAEEVADIIDEGSFKNSFNSNDQNKTLLLNMIEANMGLIARFKGAKSGYSVEHHYSPEDVRQWSTY